MHIRQAVLTAPYETTVREVELPAPAANQILVQTAYSVISAGTELAVYTGTHQWLKDPNLPDWKFPFRPGYSAAGDVVAVGTDVTGWKPGDRVSYPGNHASARTADDRPRARPAVEAAGRPGLRRRGLVVHGPLRHGRGIRAGLTLGRSAAVLGLGIIGQFALRCLLAAGASPAIGIDAVAMRRKRRSQGGAGPRHRPSPAAAIREQVRAIFWQARGAEIVADATGVPDAIPTAMCLACDGGQVVVVGSPRGKAKEVNFYDDLHRRYIEVTGAHGNMLFEPAHTRAGRRLGHRQGPELAARPRWPPAAAARRAGHAHRSRPRSSARLTRGC